MSEKCEMPVDVEFPELCKSLYENVKKRCAKTRGNIVIGGEPYLMLEYNDKGIRIGIGIQICKYKGYGTSYERSDIIFGLDQTVLDNPAKLS